MRSDWGSTRLDPSRAGGLNTSHIHTHTHTHVTTTHPPPPIHPTPPTHTRTPSRPHLQRSRAYEPRGPGHPRGPRAKMTRGSGNPRVRRPTDRGFRYTPHNYFFNYVYRSPWRPAWCAAWSLAPALCWPYMRRSVGLVGRVGLVGGGRLVGLGRSGRSGCGGACGAPCLGRALCSFLVWARHASAIYGWALYESCSLPRSEGYTCVNVKQLAL